MSYFISDKLNKMLYNLKVIVFLNSYDKLFKKVVERDYTFIRKPKKEDTMVQLLQMIFIDKAFDSHIKENEIEQYLMSPESFRGWIRVSLEDSNFYKRELVYKYKNNPDILKTHLNFMKSLEQLAIKYNSKNYINCLKKFDELWYFLSYKLN